VVETTVNNGTSTSAGTDGCAVAEDYLFLDVYTPVEAVDQGKKLPVLFWNYGVGWVGGSKNDESPEVRMGVVEGFANVVLNQDLHVGSLHAVE
jgi:carboxylesterase type B